MNGASLLRLRQLSLVLLLLFTSASHALYFYLDSMTPKCFFEELPKDTLVVGKLTLEAFNIRVLARDKDILLMPCRKLQSRRMAWPDINLQPGRRHDNANNSRRSLRQSPPSCEPKRPKRRQIHFHSGRIRRPQDMFQAITSSCRRPHGLGSDPRDCEDDSRPCHR